MCAADSVLRVGELQLQRGTKLVGGKKREELNNPLLPHPETFLLPVA